MAPPKDWRTLLLTLLVVGLCSALVSILQPCEGDTWAYTTHRSSTSNSTSNSSDSETVSLEIRPKQPDTYQVLAWASRVSGAVGLYYQPSVMWARRTSNGLSANAALAMLLGTMSHAAATLSTFGIGHENATRWRDHAAAATATTITNSSSSFGGVSDTLESILVPAYLEANEWDVAFAVHDVIIIFFFWLVPIWFSNKLAADESRKRRENASLLCVIATVIVVTAGVVCAAVMLAFELQGKADDLLVTWGTVFTIFEAASYVFIFLFYCAQVVWVWRVQTVNGWTFGGVVLELLRRGLKVAAVLWLVDLDGFIVWLPVHVVHAVMCAVLLIQHFDFTPSGKVQPTERGDTKDVADEPQRAAPHPPPAATADDIELGGDGLFASDSKDDIRHDPYASSRGQQRGRNAPPSPVDSTPRPPWPPAAVQHVNLSHNQTTHNASYQQRASPTIPPQSVAVEEQQHDDRETPRPPWPASAERHMHSGKGNVQPLPPLPPRSGPPAPPHPPVQGNNNSNNNATPREPWPEAARRHLNQSTPSISHNTVILGELERSRDFPVSSNTTTNMNNSDIPNATPRPPWPEAAQRHLRSELPQQESRTVSAMSHPPSYNNNNNSNAGDRETPRPPWPESAQRHLYNSKASSPTRLRRADVAFSPMNASTIQASVDASMASLEASYRRHGIQTPPRPPRQKSNSNTCTMGTSTSDEVITPRTKLAERSSSNNTGPTLFEYPFNA
eukprot:PhM_4_TR10087/c0_g1_i1/m.75628